MVSVSRNIGTTTKDPVVQHSKAAAAAAAVVVNNKQRRLDDVDDDDEPPKDHRTVMSRLACMSSTRMLVLLILCLQNSLFTVLRRYSQGVLKENYSKYEVLLVGEVIKMFVSARMIQSELRQMTDGGEEGGGGGGGGGKSLQSRLLFLLTTSRKMIILALIYGAMNILSFVSLRNIGAGMFTIFAQCKILTTAACSTMILGRKYSWTQWRALTALLFGVLLFSEPIWNTTDNLLSKNEDANVFVGTMAVLIEVSLSGFASIYFEKVVKIDSQKLTIWERNFQLALGSFPVYVAFIMVDSPVAGFGTGWSLMAVIVACLGAAGGLLVALSIKYGDSILKTLATTGAICLSSVLDAVWLGGPLTPIMMIAGVQVILSICNYTFDTTPVEQLEARVDAKMDKGYSERDVKSQRDPPDEEIALIAKRSTDA